MFPLSTTPPATPAQVTLLRDGSPITDIDQAALLVWLLARDYNGTTPAAIHIEQPSSSDREAGIWLLDVPWFYDADVDWSLDAMVETPEAEVAIEVRYEAAS